jgi:hypothetical protein
MAYNCFLARVASRYRPAVMAAMNWPKTSTAKVITGRWSGVLLGCVLSASALIAAVMLATLDD